MSDRAAQAPTSRSVKLRALFAKAISGKQQLTDTTVGLFLEAICDQPDPATCVQRLLSSEHGLRSLRTALQIKTSPTFLNGPFALFLQYLQAPELKSICGGEVLRRIVLTIVEPAFLWDALLQAIKAKQISDEGVDGASWLLLQLVSLPVEKAIPHCSVIEDEVIRTHLLASTRVETRSRARRIIHIAETIRTTNEPDAGGPGGRHDNDFADIHKIAILPSADELAATDPFLRRAAEVQENATGQPLLALHTDNQFRLLREDMLRDLREEIQIAVKSKAGRSRGFVVDHLVLAGILCDERQAWCIQLRCVHDIPQLRDKGSGQRRMLLRENPNFLKHQSVACLLADGEVVGLATLVRDEDMLVMVPAVLCVELSHAAVPLAFLRMKTARQITLVQLNTAVFAYEPVLRQLQEIKELSLEDEILHWKPGNPLLSPTYELSGGIRDAISKLEKDPSYNLDRILGLRRPVRLDPSQAACFTAALRQRFSLIQGPPGTCWSWQFVNFHH